MIKRYARGVIGGLLLAFTLGGGVLAPFITQHNLAEQHLDQRLKPPAWIVGGSRSYPLGTDHLGRDELARLLYGGRTSFLVAGVAVALAAVIGVSLGLIAGWYLSWGDQLIMRLVDIQLSFPFLLLAILLVFALRPGLYSVIAVLATTGWPPFCRMVRGKVIALRERDFIMAARAAGASDTRIMMRHLVMNTMSVVLVIITIEAARIMLAESSLSFLGLGVQPPMASWGTMISEGQEYMMRGWWIQTFPGIMISMAVMGTGLLGEWLRDAWDPQLRI